MRSNLNSTPELEFDEIDLTEIEYKNEYGYGRKAIFGLLGSMGSVALLLNIIPHLGWASGLMVCGSVLSIWALAIAVMMIKIKSTLLITGNGLILKRPLLGDIEIPYSEIGSMEFQDALTRKSSDRGLDIMRLDPSQIESRFG
ncbi:MAG TPA: hypothetical protein VFC63_18325, partial [Blastocatellia bacterium]|nr:hypothetical protein [Blastocatellia bacterium]